MPSPTSAAHARDLFSRRLSLEVLAHHLVADIAVTDECRDIDCGRCLLHALEQVLHRISHPAVLTDDDRRDALAHDRRGIAHLEEPILVVAVRIDEAGRQCQAAGIDTLFALPRFERTDFHDPVAVDAHGALLRRASGAVDDRGIDDQRRRRRAALRTCHESREQCRTDGRTSKRADGDSLRGLLDLLEWQAPEARRVVNEATGVLRRLTGSAGSTIRLRHEFAGLPGFSTSPSAQVFERRACRPARPGHSAHGFFAEVSARVARRDRRAAIRRRLVPRPLPLLPPAGRTQLVLQENFGDRACERSGVGVVTIAEHDDRQMLLGQRAQMFDAIADPGAAVRDPAEAAYSRTTRVPPHSPSTCRS